MGIEQKHPAYTKRESQWQRCRDTKEGQDAVKDRGDEYLPRLSKQKNEDYKAYKKRADFFGAVSRTVDGLTGAVMRVDPVVEGDIEYADDITGTGVSLGDFVQYLLAERLLMGRTGILVDHNGTRPYFTGYTTEQNTNWSDEFIILSEGALVPSADDPYEITSVDQIRELYYDGGYAVRIWRKDKDKWRVVDEITPQSRGQRLTEIPYVSISVDGANLNPEKPPLLDLADMNLSHYRSSADLEHGRHFTALPTPWVAGIDEGELAIGSQTAWLLPEGSQAGYLEFTGQGLQAIEKALEDKRSMMASLGAQLLQSQKSGVEAAETLKIRENAEASVLMKAVKDVETGINRAIEYMANWEGKTPATIKLNTDYSDVGMSSQDMTALMQAYQSGSISHDTFLYQMKRGEILPPDREIEDEKDLIGLAGPAE